MDWVDNGNAGICIPIVQEHNLQTSVGRVYEKTPTWGIVLEEKGEKQVRDISAAAQIVFHVEQLAKVIDSCPETGDPYICRKRLDRIFFWTLFFL